MTTFNVFIIGDLFTDPVNEWFINKKGGICLIERCDW